jgi:hypothetical protein
LHEDYLDIVEALYEEFNVRQWAGAWYAWDIHGGTFAVEFIGVDEYDGRIRRPWSACGKCMLPENEKLRTLKEDREAIGSAFFENHPIGSPVFFVLDEKQRFGFVEDYNEFGVFVNVMEEKPKQLFWERLEEYRISDKPDASLL